MFIRMTSGRDRGEAKEFSFTDAQDLIESGRAVVIDFSETDPLAKIDNFEVRDRQSQLAAPALQLARPDSAGTQSIMANRHQKTRRKP
jgi:hypothetical protein